MGSRMKIAPASIQGAAPAWNRVVFDFFGIGEKMVPNIKNRTVNIGQ